MFGYIYKTTDLETGKIYVGQKKSPKFLGLAYVGSGKIIRRIAKRCKESNIDLSERFSVELLEECSSQEELNDREIYWISAYNSHSDCGYNLNDGGGGGNHNLGKTFQDRKEHDFSGENNPMYGKHHSEETKKKISNANSGKTFSDEINKSKGRKGKTLTEDHKNKIREANSGVEFSPEHKENISKSRVGKVFITNGTETKCIYPEDFVEYDQTMWRLGRTFNSNPWNKGLSADTDDRLKEIGEKTKKTRIENGGYIPWNRKD